MTTTETTITLKLSEYEVSVLMEALELYSKDSSTASCRHGDHECVRVLTSLIERQFPEDWK